MKLRAFTCCVLVRLGLWGSFASRVSVAAKDPDGACHEGQRIAAIRWPDRDVRILSVRSGP